MIENPNLLPALTMGEQALLQAASVGRRSGIEFGCGGSTALLLAAGLEQLLSVDSDAGWLRRVLDHPTCRQAQESRRLRLLHIDLGPVGAWGWPQDAQRATLWSAYWREPWEAAGSADFVFVDGRFRIACALNSLPRLQPDGVVLVHDFWSREAYRAPLLRHFDLLGSAESLALLAPRQPVNAALLAADLAAHALDPR
jgi:Methyltransferase domain